MQASRATSSAHDATESLAATATDLSPAARTPAVMSRKPMGMVTCIRHESRGTFSLAQAVANF